MLICTALAMLAAGQPLVGLALLPAALPVIGLMPWTGWLTVEELDLAVLAVAAGGYARLALRPPPAATAAGATAMKGLLLFSFAVALIVSMARGFADAGGLNWGWWQGYHEPMNSVRVAKSFFLAILLVPLWRTQLRATPDRAERWLGTGLAGGLLMVAIPALWERWAHTGLANFSSDYRTTALFWEMHVGGAAFDGFLALTMPFAVRELLRQVEPWRWALAAAAVVLGAYACLTTFSRGVYLAVPVGLVAMAGLQALSSRRIGTRAGAPVTGQAGGVAAVVICAAFIAGAITIFPTSGYRGMLALFGAVVLLLPMAVWLQRTPARGWAVGVAGGLSLSLLLALVAYALPKGPYLVYALAWAATAAALLSQRWPSPALLVPWWGALILTAWLALLASMLLVATHWGGEPALSPMAVVVLLLLAFAVVSGRGTKPRWPQSLRWQGGVAGAMVVLTIMVGVMLGGAYMGDRFTTGGRDLDDRLQHWAQGLSLLNDQMAWAFGKGTGRYPANHFLSGKPEDQVGDYRLREEGGARHLVLTAGKHLIDWAQLLRVSQRVGPFTGPVTMKVDARSDVAVTLHFEICRKHLLYDDGDCAIASVPVKAQAGLWQSLVVQLPGKGLSGGDFFAPHFLTFSVAVKESGRSVELDNLRAIDASGRELLVNGDFEGGMARWFFSSDRHHMPWHMKNMLLHVLFEQGWVGLVLFCGLVLSALWRVSWGNARDHTLSPAIGAAVLGFLVVGLFDSLLDAPRVAFLFYLLLMIALTLPAQTALPRGRASAPP
ncbi:MAG: hypothetical protein J0M13_17110 [Candidatus Accumulibacter sp.]|uniref:O-antigen ligase family protein n=1 Tax=Candidatus Accumulibacter necessarius TaxID=2954386 RepID=UPI001AC1A2AA|nr:hypothetical protein [Candidatus Accumulibacter necessarius]